MPDWKHPSGTVASQVVAKNVRPPSPPPWSACASSSPPCTAISMETANAARNSLECITCTQREQTCRECRQPGFWWFPTLSAGALIPDSTRLNTGHGPTQQRRYSCWCIRCCIGCLPCADLTTTLPSLPPPFPPLDCAVLIHLCLRVACSCSCRRVRWRAPRNRMQQGSSGAHAVFVRRPRTRPHG